VLATLDNATRRRDQQSKADIEYAKADLLKPNARSACRKIFIAAK